MGWRRCIAPLAGLVLAACGSVAQLPVSAGMGPAPELPPPEHALIPTVQVAEAKGWPEGATPTPAPGLTVTRFAAGLMHPRSVYVLPNGDVLVAETNAPPKPEDGKGLKGAVMKLLMRKAGSTGESANRITLLRDTDGDGSADARFIFLQGLHSPFGMALVGNDLYVANTDAVMRFPYTQGATSISGSGTKVVDLPAGPINHHWTKNVAASPDGAQLFVSVGSNSNAGENGLAAEEGRAAVWSVDPRSGEHRVYASGLRNPNGLAFEPQTGALWTAVNERDELGSDLVPDYMTALREGAFYGWPFSYFGAHVDDRVKPPQPEMVARALVPDYALGPHTASLGLASAQGARLGERFATGMFVGQHGSWNRKPPSGYKVIFVPFANGRPSGPAIDVLWGFLSERGDAYGRPVGVAIDRNGGLLVADDVGNCIWRVSAAR
jgi:glucose/arabinose dehydrogenase